MRNLDAELAYFHTGLMRKHEPGAAEIAAAVGNSPFVLSPEEREWIVETLEACFAPVTAAMTDQSH